MCTCLFQAAAATEGAAGEAAVGVAAVRAAVAGVAAAAVPEAEGDAVDRTSERPITAQSAFGVYPTRKTFIIIVVCCVYL